MRKHIILTLLILGIEFTAAFAQQICPLRQNMRPKGISSLESFKRIAISDQGRIKPLDTYARNFMVQLSGKDSFDENTAIEWLAKLLFAPDTTREDKVFLIRNAEVLESLGITARGKGQYSYSQIDPALKKLANLAQSAREIEEGSRNIVGNEILRLYQDVVLYTNLANSFSFAIPNSDFQVGDEDVVRLLDLPQGKNVYSFWDIASKAEVILTATEGVETNKAQEKTAQEKELLRLLGDLYRWSTFYENHSVSIVPIINPQEKSWLSPWEAINREFKDPEIKEEIHHLRDLVVHYWNGDQLQFDMAARIFQDSVKNRFGPFDTKSFDGFNFEIEILYQRLKPLFWARLFYGASFFVLVFSKIFKRIFLQYFSLLLIIPGFIFHAWIVIAHAVIMGLSPITNLYGAFTFAGLMCISIGLGFMLRHKIAQGIFISSVCGFVFLFIANRFPGLF